MIVDILNPVKNANTIEEATYFFAGVLIHKRTLDKLCIDIEFEDLGEDHGFCEKTDDFDYTITLNSNLSLMNMIKTLAHEMVHVKQHAKKELKDSNGAIIWKKKLYRDYNYFEAPWEVEAYSMEDDLLELYIKEGAPKSP